MKRVLLIHPWIEDFSAYDFWIKPLGLLTVGTLLKEAGLDVALVDCLDRAVLNAPDRQYGKGKIPCVEITKPGVLQPIPRRFKRFGMDDETFRKKVVALGRPDLVLVTSMMTYWYTGAFRAIRLVKEIYPDVPVGLGGNYVTLCQSHAEQHSGADILFPSKDLDSVASMLQSVLGIRERPLRGPLHRRDYSFYAELRSLPLLTSLGCPYRCTYCAAHRLYPGFVQEDPDRVVSEIEANVQEFGVKDFAFFDDALLVNAPEHFHKILEGVIRKGLDLRFHLPNAVHAGAVTPETAELMFQAGFKTVRLGLESSDSRFQKKDSSGKLNNRKFLKGVLHLQCAGFTASELGAYVLCGMPGQAEASIIETLGLVQEAGIRAYLSTFSPVPGTPYFDLAAQYDPRIRHEPLLHNKHVSSFRDEPAFRRIKEETNRMNHSLPHVTTEDVKRPPARKDLYKSFDVH